MTKDRMDPLEKKMKDLEAERDFYRKSSNELADGVEKMDEIIIRQTNEIEGYKKKIAQPENISNSTPSITSIPPVPSAPSTSDTKLEVPSNPESPPPLPQSTPEKTDTGLSTSLPPDASVIKTKGLDAEEWFVKDGILQESHREESKADAPIGKVDGPDFGFNPNGSIGIRRRRNKMINYTYTIYGVVGAIIALTGLVADKAVDRYFNARYYSIEPTEIISSPIISSPLEQKVEPTLNSPTLSFPKLDALFNQFPLLPGKPVSSNTLVVADSSPNVVYSDEVFPSDLALVVAAGSLEKTLTLNPTDTAPVILVEKNIIHSKAVSFVRNAFLETVSLSNPDCVSEGPDFYLENKIQAALAERARILHQVYTPPVEVAPKLTSEVVLKVAAVSTPEKIPEPPAQKIVALLPVYPENALFELTFKGESCAPASLQQDWYANFTAPESFRKDNFMVLFHQYVKERGKEKFLQDFNRKDYFDVFALSHSKDSGYCSKARMFGERVFQWAGDTPTKVRSCVYHKKCK